MAKKVRFTIKKMELKVVTLLAAVIAMATVGQLALQGIALFRDSLWMPEIVSRTIVFAMFWASFIFIFIALNMYRKL